MYAVRRASLDVLVSSFTSFLSCRTRYCLMFCRQVTSHIFTRCSLTHSEFIPLTATLKPQSNGPLYSNTVIDTLAVTFGTARRGLGGLRPRQSPTRCTKCNSPPINGQCTNFILFDVALWFPLNCKRLICQWQLLCLCHIVCLIVPPCSRSFICPFVYLLPKLVNIIFWKQRNRF